MSWRDKLVALIPNPLVRLFATPYIAGNSSTIALECAEQLWNTRGLQTTLDLLGEGIRERSDIQQVLDEYLRIIDQIKDGEYITVSLKPTQMGLAIDPKLCQVNLEKICDAAEAKGIGIALDMEESDYTSAILSMYRELCQTYSHVGTVLQSRLFRTSDDIDEYLKDRKGHIRLCIGIYVESSEIAHTDKRKMKENFYELARKLWEEGHFVAIATHDEVLIRRCLALAKEMNIPQERYEFQMLLGVPRHEIQQELLAQDIPVRLYVPYGTSWDDAYAYSRRRLAENPSIAIYVARNVLQEIWNVVSGKRRRRNKEMETSK